MQTFAQNKDIGKDHKPPLPDLIEMEEFDSNDQFLPKVTT